MLTAFPCANVRNCLFRDNCCSNVFDIALHSPCKCRMTVSSCFVKVQVCTSNQTSLMFKEALTSLQASIATSDISVCSSGAAWLRSTHCSKRSSAVSSSLAVFLQSLLKSVFTVWSCCLCVANASVFHEKLNTVSPTSSWLQMVIKFSVLIPCDISLLVIRVAETLCMPLLFPSWTLSCFLLNHPKTVSEIVL